MKRREFISLLGGVAVAQMGLPLSAGAQQRDQKRHVAVLMGGLVQGETAGKAEATALEEGLKELGWQPGRNINLDYHWPGADLDTVQAAAKQIAATHPDLVVSRSTPATAALQNSGLPIIFVLVADPLGSGFVQNLARPGGNLTGFSNFEESVGGKWLELLKEASPPVSQVSFLFNPGTAPYAPGYLHSAQSAAQTLGAAVIATPCSSIEDIEEAFGERAHEGGGIIVVIDTFLSEHRDLIVQLATRHRLPAIYGSQVFVPSGGLMSYAVDYPDLCRRAAAYVDRVLRGAHPAELPVQAPAKFVLSINLKAASAIGLSLPQTLIVRADEVIE